MFLFYVLIYYIIVFGIFIIIFFYQCVDMIIIFDINIICLNFMLLNPSPVDEESLVPNRVITIFPFTSMLSTSAVLPNSANTIGAFNRNTLPVRDICVLISYNNAGFPFHCRKNRSKPGYTTNRPSAHISFYFSTHS